MGIGIGDRTWTGNGIGLARQVRAISSQVAPISHIILSVCVKAQAVVRGQGKARQQSGLKNGEGSKGRTSSFNIKRIYETFSFHFDNQKGRTTAVGRGEGRGDRGNRQLDGRNVAHV